MFMRCFAKCTPVTKTRNLCCADSFRWFLFHMYCQISILVLNQYKILESLFLYIFWDASKIITYAEYVFLRSKIEHATSCQLVQNIFQRNVIDSPILTVPKNYINTVDYCDLNEVSASLIWKLKGGVWCSYYWSPLIVNFYFIPSAWKSIIFFSKD